MTIPWSRELEALERKKRIEVEDALIACSGHVTATALRLGIARSYLNKLLGRFDLVERARELRLDGGLPLVGRRRKTR